MISTTMPAVLDPRQASRRKRLTQAAQSALNEWYELHGKQPWQVEHPGGVTPTTITGKTK